MPDVVFASFNAHAGVRPRPVSLPYLRHTPRPDGSSPGDGPSRFDLVGAIVGLDADIVVVQEAFRPDHGLSPLDEAAGKLGYDVHQVMFGRATLQPWPHLSPANGTGEVGLAVLSRYPLLERTEVPVRPVPFDPAPARRALHLRVDVEGVPLDVVGVHLTSRLPYGPAMQLRRLRPLLPTADRLAVAAGDFNLWGRAVSALLEGWKRPVRGRTWPAHRPHSQIDHVLVRPGVEVLSAGVLEDAGSDHLPIRAHLRLPS